MSIPKESSPNIKFGVVNISTIYPGTNPVDMDALVTEKLYKEIKDIKGSKKITTSSSLGMSTVTIELQPETNTMNFMTEVRNNIGRVILPKDAKSPNVIEMKTDTNRVYDATFYSPDKSVSLDKLRLLGQKIKDKLSTLPEVEKIIYGNTNIYDIRIVFDEREMRAMKLTIDQVAAAIRSYHQDAPIGNFGVGERNYDFRIGGKFEGAQKFLEVPVTLSTGKAIRVGDIAHIERYYKDTSISRVGFFNGTAYESVNMTINKNDSPSIFAASNATKNAIEAMLKTTEFKGVKVAYANDLADNINDDYKELTKEALITTTLVFIVMWLFVGFFDSLFATLTLPIAFFATFILLNKFGFSLNFLTNLSLILSFGIAVDTIIVIVQAASAKIRIGHEPRSAIMIALREYALPISAGVMTTILAFLPMMVLPGVIGKFLAYIPITIF
jgi:multidrug efflux pump subunit AcrB